MFVYSIIKYVRTQWHELHTHEHTLNAAAVVSIFSGTKLRSQARSQLVIISD